MTILTLALTTIAIILILYVAVSWHKLANFNQYPLEIRTFDRSDSPYHPSVLYFKNGWNGYKYWMVETPFSPQCKPYRDRNECPSIHVSNDGISWHEINVNPIDDLNDEEVKNLDYFSDPHLVFTNNQIECWYRISRRHGNINAHSNVELVRKISHDGINWSEREHLVDFTSKKQLALGKIEISHSVLYLNSEYNMWFVDYEDKKNDKRHIRYSKSPDGKVWSKASTCILSDININPWHIDVNYIGACFWLICYDYKNISLWSSIDGIHFSFDKILLKPSVIGSFYGNGLYRAVLIKDYEYKLYFSADNFNKTHIGVMRGKRPMDLEVFSCKPSSFCSFWKMTKDILEKKKRSVSFVLKRFVK